LLPNRVKTDDDGDDDDDDDDVASVAGTSMDSVRTRAVGVA
jgi:hypothetical protein